MAPRRSPAIWSSACRRGVGIELGEQAGDRADPAEIVRPRRRPDPRRRRRRSRNRAARSRAARSRPPPAPLDPRRIGEGEGADGGLGRAQRLPARSARRPGACATIQSFSVARAEAGEDAAGRRARPASGDARRRLRDRRRTSRRGARRSGRTRPRRAASVDASPISKRSPARPLARSRAAAIRASDRSRPVIAASGQRVGEREAGGAGAAADVEDRAAARTAAARATSASLTGRERAVGPPPFLGPGLADPALPFDRLGHAVS